MKIQRISLFIPVNRSFKHSVLYDDCYDYETEIPVKDALISTAITSGLVIFTGWFYLNSKQLVKSFEKLKKYLHML